MKPRIITSLFAVALALLPTSAAEAWLTTICNGNGKLQHGLHNDVPHWEVVEGSDNPALMDIVGDALAHGNSIQGVHDRFPSYGSYPLFRAPDWYVWQITLWAHDSGPLYAPGDDSFAGVAELHYRQCSSGGGMRGATIYLDETVSQATVRETHGGSTMRGVLVHELGHVLGMLHEDDKISAMNTYLPVPKAGTTTPGGTSHTLGPEHMWADESLFMKEYHRDYSYNFNEDLIASPWRYNASTDRNRLIYPGGETVNRCQGETFDVTYTTANLGLVDAPDVPVWIVLSSNDKITTADTIARATLTSRSGGYSSEVTKTITVPDVGAGSWFVGVIVDPQGVVSESAGDNNTSLTGLKVNISGSCFL